MDNIHILPLAKRRVFFKPERAVSRHCHVIPKAQCRSLKRRSGSTVQARQRRRGHIWNYAPTKWLVFKSHDTFVGVHVRGSSSLRAAVPLSVSRKKYHQGLGPTKLMYGHAINTPTADRVAGMRACSHILLQVDMAEIMLGRIFCDGNADFNLMPRLQP